jgi:hypothetical protein
MATPKEGKSLSADCGLCGNKVYLPQKVGNNVFSMEPTTHRTDGHVCPSCGQYTWQMVLDMVYKFTPDPLKTYWFYGQDGVWQMERPIICMLLDRAVASGNLTPVKVLESKTTTLLDRAIKPGKDTPVQVLERNTTTYYLRTDIRKEKSELGKSQSNICRGLWADIKPVGVGGFRHSVESSDPEPPVLDKQEETSEAPTLQKQESTETPTRAEKKEDEEKEKEPPVLVSKLGFLYPSPLPPQPPTPPMLGDRRPRRASDPLTTVDESDEEKDINVTYLDNSVKIPAVQRGAREVLEKDEKSGDH